MKKRGQVDSHIFAYILTILIVGGVVAMGYKYITQVSSTVRKGDVLQLQSKIAADIKSIGKEFGKFRKVTYSLPENLDEVCFIDLMKKNEILSSKLVEFYPIIKDIIKTDAPNNLFLFGSNYQQSYSVKNFEISHYPYFHCFRGREGKISYGLSGLGGGKTLLLGDFLTKARVNSKKAVILQSADGVVALEIPYGTTSNNNEISIEMIEPPAGKENGASDVYRLEPAGTEFSQPIELKIKFNPNVVGVCPSVLVFNQVNQETGATYAENSKSINCENYIATFEIKRFI